MKEYVDILDFALPYLYGPWDLEKFHARASSEALGLRKILSSASLQALGFKKMLKFPFLQLQPIGEVSLFCLLHLSSELFLLTYSSKKVTVKRMVSQPGSSQCVPN